MGCGKSTVGRNLAAFIFSDYIDLDSYIEKRIDIPVKEFFALKGEVAFREEEKRALEEILLKYAPICKENSSEKSNLIISLGGGAPTYPPTAKLIKEKTFCVYLSASKETLFKRLSRNSTNRPVLQGKQGGSLISYIEELVAKRESFYKEVSKMELDSSKLSIPQLTEQLSGLF